MAVSLIWLSDPKVYGGSIVKCTFTFLFMLRKLKKSKDEMKGLSQTVQIFKFRNSKLLAANSHDLNFEALEFERIDSCSRFKMIEETIVSPNRWMRRFGM